MSWSAFEDIARKKTHELAPLTDPDLSAEHLKENTKIHAKIEQDLLGQANRLKIQDPATSGAALDQSINTLMNTLADAQLTQNIEAEITNPDLQKEIKAKLLASFKGCQDINAAIAKRNASRKTSPTTSPSEDVSASQKEKKVDCVDALSKAAVLEIFQNAVSENINRALGDEAKKNPEFAEHLIQKIKSTHMSQEKLDKISAVATNKEERNKLLHQVQNEITADVAKEFLHYKTADLLPPSDEQTLAPSDQKSSEKLKALLNPERFLQTPQCSGRTVSRSSFKFLPRESLRSRKTKATTALALL